GRSGLRDAAGPLHEERATAGAARRPTDSRDLPTFGSDRAVTRARSALWRASVEGERLSSTADVERPSTRRYAVAQPVRDRLEAPFVQGADQRRLRRVDEGASL